MEHPYFKSIETLSNGSTLKLEDILSHLNFDERGLIPVITQDVDSKDVLTFAWMNKEALQRTLRDNQMTYWSRSRQSFWIKGETSGHTQALVSMAFDCDGDVILCQVKQQGAACHTGRRDCFYLQVDNDKLQVIIKGDAKL